MPKCYISNFNKDLGLYADQKNDLLFWFDFQNFA